MSKNMSKISKEPKDTERVAERVTTPSQLKNSSNADTQKIYSFEVSLKEWHEMYHNIVEIRNLVLKEIKDNEVEKQAFERLYDELEMYKRDKFFEDNKPLYLDLLLLYDRIQLLQEEKGSFESDILESLQEELVEILCRCSIEIIKRDNHSFDPHFQRVVKTQTVEGAELEGRVLQVARNGFMYKDKLLRPQEVVIGKWVNQRRQHAK